MTARLLGAALVMAGCGAVGFSAVRDYRSQMQTLRNLRNALQEMLWELKYRVSPLPELCRVGAQAARGQIRQILNTLALRLETGDTADVSGCLNGLSQDLPRGARRVMGQLAPSLGRYDLEGQIQGLETAMELCRKELKEMEEGSKERLRGCQTLALCAGAALVILLI